MKTSEFVAENVVYVWMGGANREKNLRFRIYPDTCGRGLSCRSRFIYVIVMTLDGDKLKQYKDYCLPSIKIKQDRSLKRKSFNGNRLIQTSKEYSMCVYKCEA